MSLSTDIDRWWSMQDLFKYPRIQYFDEKVQEKTAQDFSLTEMDGSFTIYPNGHKKFMRKSDGRKVRRAVNMEGMWDVSNVCEGGNAKSRTQDMHTAGMWGETDVERRAATSIAEHDLVFGRPEGDSLMADDMTTLTLRLVETTR